MIMIVNQSDICDKNQVTSWIKKTIKLISEKAILVNQTLKPEYFNIPANLTMDKTIKILTDELKQWSKLEPLFDSFVGATVITEIDSEKDQMTAMFYMAMLLKIIRKNQTYKNTRC